MMASLYQSGSASGAPAPGLAAVRGERLEGLTSLILPGPPRSSWAPLSGNPEDVGYRGGRIELDIVTTPSPCVGGTVQEVVDLKRFVRPACVWCGSKLTTTRITLRRSGVCLL